MGTSWARRDGHVGDELGEQHGSAVLAFGWAPEIRGIIFVTIGVVALCGSVYLVLGTNLGFRLGFLVAMAGLFGWMLILGWCGWPTPGRLRARPPGTVADVGGRGDRGRRPHAGQLRGRRAATDLESPRVRPALARRRPGLRPGRGGRRRDPRAGDRARFTSTDQYIRSSRCTTRTVAPTRRSARSTSSPGSTGRTARWSRCSPSSRRRPSPARRPAHAGHRREPAAGLRGHARATSAPAGAGLAAHLRLGPAIFVVLCYILHRREKLVRPPERRLGAGQGRGARGAVEAEV